MLQWFQQELTRTNVPATVRLPTPEEAHRAVRGQLTWLFPWGRRFDATFCETADRGATAWQRSPSLTEILLNRAAHCDFSAFGVARLAGRVSELVEDPHGVGSFGGAFSNSRTGVEQNLRLRLMPHATTASADWIGVRFAFRPHQARREPAAVGDPANDLLALEAAEGELERQPRAALRIVDEMLQRDDRSGRAWSTRGGARLQLADFWGAAWDFSAALERAPSDATTVSNRGFAHLGRGDAQAAIRDFSRCLELDPDHAGAWLGRCQARLSNGDLPDARLDLDEAASRLGSDHPAVANARRLLARRGD